MAKRASLAGPPPAPSTPSPAPATEPTGVKSRTGRIGISFWVDPDAHRQMRHLALDTGQSVQAVMEEALDLWFREHGKARIAAAPRRSRTAA